MDNFLHIVTTREQPATDSTCQALEEAGIPLMIEHVEVAANGEWFPGYKIYVPPQHSSRALRLVHISKGR